MTWCRHGDLGLILPDATFYLDAEPEMFQHRGDYGRERFESLEMQAAVRAVFHTLITASWHVIATAPDLAHFLIDYGCQKTRCRHITRSGGGGIGTHFQIICSPSPYI